MTKTTEHIGKVAVIRGNLSDFVGDSDLMTWLRLNGFKDVAPLQACDSSGVYCTFIEIAGEIDSDVFSEIMTKAEANALIRSWFTPEYTVVRREYFERYLDMHLTSAQLDHIDTLESTQDIYAYLLEQGFKFIRVTTFDGPQFDIPAEEA